MQEKIPSLIPRFSDASPENILSYFLKEYRGEIAFSTSLSAEDQVLTDIILGICRDCKIFTLDTGRLFYESYEVLDRTNARYNIHIEVFFPDYKEVEEMVKSKGINLFYESIEKRKLCCNIRKLHPMQRALQGMKIWITGLRKEQSLTRENMQVLEWDNTLNILKINPLINWSEEDVWNYIRKHKLPYNILHDKGYPSIGCAPCTRAVEKGENPRNGRWWWENPETRECGLHLHVKTG
jgi:phosphoadenosine phosphosulfate reductase